MNVCVKAFFALVDEKEKKVNTIKFNNIISVAKRYSSAHCIFAKITALV